MLPVSQKASVELPDYGDHVGGEVRRLVTLNSRRASWAMGILIILLGAAHFLLSDSGIPLARIFHLDQEAGLGTWMSSPPGIADDHRGQLLYWSPE